jgi:hypothetical protein
MGKDTLNTYGAAVNRQETYNHAAGSSTSAVGMSHMESEYPDEDLPSYEETSSSAPLLSGSAHDEPSRNAHPVRGMSWYMRVSSNRPPFSLLTILIVLHPNYPSPAMITSQKPFRPDSRNTRRTPMLFVK